MNCRIYEAGRAGSNHAWNDFQVPQSASCFRVTTLGSKRVAHESAVVNGLAGLKLSFPMDSIRILIVDDHAIFRRSLRLLLSSRSDWVVCGEAVDGLDAVEKAKSLHPDVVLMDISMPRMNGIEATRTIRQEVPRSKIIVISQNDPTIASRLAAEIGAGGFVAKTDLYPDLLTLIDRVAEDRKYEEADHE